MRHLGIYITYATCERYNIEKEVPLPHKPTIATAQGSVLVCPGQPGVFLVVPGLT